MRLSRRPDVRKLQQKGDVAGLIRALHEAHDDTRLSATRALAGLGDQRAVEPLGALLSDEKVLVRLEAAIGLGRLGDPRGVETLSALLAHSSFDIWFTAGRALRGIGTPRALKAFVGALGDDREQVVKFAIDALSRVSDQDVIDDLFDALEDPKRSTAALAVLGTLKAPTSERLLDLVVRRPELLSTRENATVRSIVKSASGRVVSLLLDGDAAVRRRMAELLRGPDGYPGGYHPPLEVALLEAVPNLVRQADTEVLVSLAEASTPAFRSRILTALGQAGEVRAAAAAVRQLRFWRGNPDEIEQLGSAAREALRSLARRWGGSALGRELLDAGALGWVDAGVLGKVEEPEALAALAFVALHNRDAKISSAAFNAVVGLGSDAVDTLVPLLRSDDADVIGRAAEALGRIGDPSAVDPIAEALQRKALEPGTVATLIRALRAIRGPGAIERLVAIVQNGGVDPWRRARAAEALGDLGAVEAHGPLATVSEAEPPGSELRRSVGAALARIASEARRREADERMQKAIREVRAAGGPERLVESVAALGDRDPGVRKAATEELARLGDLRAVDPLIAVLEGDEQQDVRAMAAWALGQLKDVRAVAPLLRSGPYAWSYLLDSFPDQLSLEQLQEFSTWQDEEWFEDCGEYPWCRRPYETHVRRVDYSWLRNLAMQELKRR